MNNNNNLNIYSYIEQAKQPRKAPRVLYSENVYSSLMFSYYSDNKINDIFKGLNNHFLDNAETIEEAKEWLKSLNVVSDSIYSSYFNEEFSNEDEYNNFIKNKLEKEELSVINMVKHENIEYVFKVVNSDDIELIYTREDTSFFFENMEKKLNKRLIELEKELNELEEELDDYENIMEELDEEEVKTIEQLALFFYNQPRYLELKNSYFFSILWLAIYEMGYNEEHKALMELLGDTETMEKLALKSKLEQQLEQLNTKLEQLNTTQKKGVKI